MLLEEKTKKTLISSREIKKAIVWEKTTLVRRDIGNNCYLFRNNKQPLPHDEQDLTELNEYSRCLLRNKKQPIMRNKKQSTPGKKYNVVFVFRQIKNIVNQFKM